MRSRKNKEKTSWRDEPLPSIMEEVDLCRSGEQQIITLPTEITKPTGFFYPSIDILHGSSLFLISAGHELILQEFGASINIEKEVKKWRRRINGAIYFFAVIEEKNNKIELQCVVRCILDSFHNRSPSVKGITRRIVIDYMCSKPSQQNKGHASRLITFIKQLCVKKNANLYVSALEDSCVFWMSKDFLLEQDEVIKKRLNIFPDTHLLKFCWNNAEDRETLIVNEDYIEEEDEESSSSESQNNSSAQDSSTYESIPGAHRNAYAVDGEPDDVDEDDQLLQAVMNSLNDRTDKMTQASKMKSMSDVRFEDDVLQQVMRESLNDAQPAEDEEYKKREEKMLSIAKMRSMTDVHKVNVVDDEQLKEAMRKSLEEKEIIQRKRNQREQKMIEMAKMKSISNVHNDEDDLIQEAMRKSLQEHQDTATLRRKMRMQREEQMLQIAKMESIRGITNHNGVIIETTNENQFQTDNDDDDELEVAEAEDFETHQKLPATRTKPTTPLNSPSLPHKKNNGLTSPTLLTHKKNNVHHNECSDSDLAKAIELSKLEIQTNTQNHKNIHDDDDDDEELMKAILLSQKEFDASK